MLAAELDTDHAERHPIGARVLELTMAQTALNAGDERTAALRKSVSELLKRDEPRKRYGATMSGLDVHYDLGAGHPLLGRRVPDVDLTTDAGPRRLFTFLHEARPLLLNLGEPGALDIAPWAERVRRVDARYPDAWELPVLGALPAPRAVLVGLRDMPRGSEMAMPRGSRTPSRRGSGRADDRAPLGALSGHPALPPS